MFIEKINFWDYIKKEKRPVVLYGMGNASEKIYSLLTESGVKVSDIFASDEFVRGHSFLGHTVVKFSDICNKYNDCVILVCFATFIPEVIDNIKMISERFDTYAPYISMFNDELCTDSFISENINDIEKACSLLADEKSVSCFESIINYMITGKCQYLIKCQSPREEVFSDIIKLNEQEIFLDLGAYSGDTIKEFINLTSEKYDKIIALEPDVKNFKKLEKTLSELKINADIYPFAVWDRKAELEFDGRGGRNSTLGKGYKVEARSVDDILNGDKATYIKMDVEGAETQALEGAEITLKKYSPKLAVSAYHKTADIFSLILLIHRINPDYKIYLRHHPYIPAFETNIYAIPNRAD